MTSEKNINKQIILSDNQYDEIMEHLEKNNPQIVEHPDNSFSIVIGNLTIDFVNQTMEAVSLINMKMIQGIN